MKRVRVRVRIVHVQVLVHVANLNLSRIYNMQNETVVDCPNYFFFKFCVYHFYNDAKLNFVECEKNIQHRYVSFGDKRKKSPITMTRGILEHKCLKKSFLKRVVNF